MWKFLRPAPKPARAPHAWLTLESLEDRAVPSAFTEGNLVIYRVGDGSASLTNTGNAVFLDEYDPSGNLMQSLAMPTKADGSQNQLIASGTAASEGMLTLSADGHYLMLTGYAADLGGPNSLPGTGTSLHARVVGRVDSQGNIDTTTALTDFSSAASPRGVASTDGTDIWVTGGAGGVRYTTLGKTTSTQLSTTLANVRGVAIFDGQLYVSTMSGSSVRLGTVGTGLPTSSGQTISNLPGFPTSTGSPYAFFFADLSADVAGVDTLYVADDTSSTGGIQKYSLVKGSWTLNNTVTVSSVRGITGVVADGVVTLYATNGSELIALTDKAGYNAQNSGSASTIATAASNTAFRGVAFAPVAAKSLVGTPSVEDAKTTEDTLTESGLVILPGDGKEETKFYQVTNIQNGTLYKSDGKTQLKDGEFITIDEGKEGLRFLPDTDLNDNTTKTFSLDVQASNSDTAAGLGGDVVTATIFVAPVNDAPSFDIAGNVKVSEDSGDFSQTAFASNFKPGPATATDESGQSATYSLSNDNTSLFSSQPAIDASGKLTFTPAKDKFGSATVTVTVDDGGGTDNGGVATSQRVFTITISPVADRPDVTGTNTNEDTQSTSGLVITRNTADGTEVTHFKITSIESGKLFKNDGKTEIKDGDFITAEEGAAGLKYTPDANFNGVAHFAIRAALDSAGTGLSSPVTASISVNAIGDPPTISDATTREDTQSDNGLVIDRNAVDGTEIGYFKITNIQNGTLYKSDGTTQIKDGGFITYDEGNAGLKFTPDADFFGTASFDVRGSRDEFGFGLGDPTTATIIVSPVADTPNVTDATTPANTQTTSGLVISPNPVDGDSVTHFLITNIQHGTLFLSDGTTPVNDGDLVPVKEAGKGLKFTPDANFAGAASFDVQASIADIGTGGDVVTATITVTPLFTPSVTSAATSEDTPTASGLVITANPADGGLTAYYQVTNITGGTLFLHDGATQVVDGDFIAASDGAAGLVFRPDADLNDDTTSFFGFDVQASTTGDGSGLAGSPVIATVTVSAVNDEPTFALAGNVTADEDGGSFSQSGFASNITPGPVTATDENTQTLTITVKNDNNSLFAVQPAIDATGNLTFTPAPTAFGSATVTVTVTDSGSNVAPDDNASSQTFTITVKPVADTPPVTNATTDEDTQTASGLVISRNAADGSEVTHFKITDIQNGKLFQSDGTTEIKSGDFITFAQATAGLRFTPAANFSGTASFDVQASLSGDDSGLGGDAVTATITVNPVADTPSVTDATTNEDTQSTSGLVISRNTADGSEVTHFQITNITNGTLFLNDGVTPVADGGFITSAQGAAGLKFTPLPNLNSATAAFGFDVQASLSASAAALGGGTAHATVTVNAVNDEPSAVLLFPSITVSQDSGPFARTGFAAFNPGGGIDEVLQTATYALTNTNPALFAVQPAISPGGALTFTPAPGMSGTAVVTVLVHDSGSNAAPNDNAGAPRQFAITVNSLPPVNIDAPLPPVGPTTPAAGAQFIVIGTDAGQLGRVRVLNATTGENVRDLVPFAGFTGGIQVAVGDVTGDGIDDVAAATATGAAHVKVFDGVTGAEVMSFLAFPGFGGGVTLAAGDLDGDGRADIVAGAATGPSHVKAFSGRDGSVLLSFLAFPGFAGGVKVAAGDVTGDGRAGIAVIAGRGGNGHVKTFDGRTGATLNSFLGYEGYAGEINLAVGDVDGDGRAEVITVAQNPRSGAHVKAFSSQAEIVRSFFAPTTIGATTGAPRTPDVAVVAYQAPRVSAGDLTGDRAADILLGDPPGTAASMLLALDGRTGSILQNQAAFDALFNFGVFVDV